MTFQEFTWAPSHATTLEWDHDLLDLLTPPEWHKHAACRGMDPNVFFPTGPGGYPGHRDTDIALTICATCPVRARELDGSGECLEAGLHEKFGVWGGMTDTGRRKLRRARGIARTPGSGQRPPCGTYGGYRAHHRHGEPVCQPCLNAHRIVRRRSEAEQRAKKKAG